MFLHSSLPSPSLQVEDLFQDMETVLANVKLLELDRDAPAVQDARLLRVRLNAEQSAFKASNKSKKRGAEDALVAEAAPAVPVGSNRSAWKCAECLTPFGGVSASNKPQGDVYCPGCTALPSVMLHKRVWLYWIDDAEWFPGRVEAYDEHSKCYRVLYVAGPACVVLLEVCVRL